MYGSGVYGSFVALYNAVLNLNGTPTTTYQMLPRPSVATALGPCPCPFFVLYKIKSALYS